MPNYTVKVTVSWPVQAVSAENAMSTVPLVVKVKHIGTESGLTEILDAATKEVVLRAQLNTDRPKEDDYGQKSEVRQVSNQMEHPDKRPDPAARTRL